MSKPFFSVIMPSHNGADRIRKALNSVQQQSYKNYELIVICDACNDDTESIAREYTSIVLNVDCHRDGLSRNAGLDIARGKWILFLDDDDWFLHEYVFWQAYEKLKRCDADMLNYSFIWKDKQYRTQNEDNIFTGTTGHIWRRSFIGDTRFGDALYGSDNDFCHALLDKRPKAVFWDMPLYYYNYLREGSLSWMRECSKKLDIIVTHYNEPWEIGKNLFDSFRIQQCVKREEVNIIIVQDGEEYSLPWKELLTDFPYNVILHTIKNHSGVCVARNEGINIASSDWIMFMDFDDMFADVASLSMITRLFPVDDDKEVIWSSYVREVNDYGRFKDTTFNCEDTFDYRLIGKLYNRKFINEHNIRFVDECHEYNDLIFNTLAISETYPFKVFKFYAPFYPFFKRYRPDGAFSSVEILQKRIDTQIDRNIILIDEMIERGKETKANAWIARTVSDAYHSIRSSELQPDENYGITDKLVNFWKNNKEAYMKISPNDIEIAFDESQTEAMSLIQEYYNYFGMEYYLQNDMISFDDFIKFLDNLASGEQPRENHDEACETNDEPANDREKRAVVYCGTKETYVNMIASVKSLLATTPVDKVYFLIEDDKFPYPIPDIIETRNVKDTGLFDPDGPNFKNVWTYMCLMRTAFPQMFPEYDKILSLDIDVVITEDVSNLWDIDLTDYYFAGVPEQGRVKEDDEDFYANFGVIMMNLKKLRDDGVAQQLVEAVNTEHFGCPEQDAFNKLCKGHIYQLPNDYNVTVYSHITGEPLKERILHYAGLKYWKHFGPVKKFYNLSWDEIMELQVKAHG